MLCYRKERKNRNIPEIGDQSAGVHERQAGILNATFHKLQAMSAAASQVNQPLSKGRGDHRGLAVKSANAQALILGGCAQQPLPLFVHCILL